MKLTLSFIPTSEDGACNSIDAAMTKEQVESIIKAHQGRFFSLTYVKENGEVRKAVAKAVAVTKKDERLSDNEATVGYFDVTVNGYRRFRLDRLVNIQGE
jgi:hypothetical protein